MAKLLKLRRGTTSQHSSFTGAEGEVTVDTNKDTLVVHDGSTAGGHELLREDMSNLPAGTIDNADVNASAAIAGTKISPDFGSQNVVTTGTLGSGAITTTGTLSITNTTPQIYLGDTDNNPDFGIWNHNGVFRLIDATNSNATRLSIVSDGTVDIPGNTNFGAGIDVTGATRALGSLTVGSGNDFQITRSSGNTEVQNYSGTLLIGNASSNSNNIFFRARADENSIECIPDGAVKLYHDGGGVKFETSSTGATVTGNLAVTGTVDGRDVASDGSKLDGIASGATNVSTENIQDIVGAMVSSNTESGITVTYQDGDGTLDFSVGTLNQNTTGNAATATALATARTIGGTSFDGTGNITPANATNADTVDSLHASSFIRSDTADSASGDITFTGGAGAVTIAAGSDLRIGGGSWTGEYNDGIKLQHNGTDSYFQYKGNTFFRNTSGDNRITIDQSGNFTAVGNVTAYSDARLKTDIHTINDALGICGKLRGVSYKWIADGKASIGVIAQEVEEVLPEVVLTNQDVNPVTQEITEVKSVDYGKIVGVLINAINELKAELDEHKKGGK